MGEQEQSHIWGNFWLILDLCQKLVAEYEEVVVDADIQKRLPHIDTVYIDAIIVHVAKIFSTSKNESFRLGQFKKILRQDLKVLVEDVERTHARTIKKILTNRNKLVAHLDKKFYNIPFSERQIKKFEEDMMSGMRVSREEAIGVYKHMPRAKEKGNERYSVVDFRDDLPEITEALNKLKCVWEQSIPFSSSK